MKKFALTLGGSVAGALAGGPVGLAVGLLGGGVVDVFRAKRKKDGGPASVTYVKLPSSVTSAGIVLPKEADKSAAQKVTVILQNALPAAGTPAMANLVGPAKSYLMKFQNSVGLPTTGTLDARTRALLVLADPKAQSLPPVTPLG